MQILTDESNQQKEAALLEKERAHFQKETMDIEKKFPWILREREFAWVAFLRTEKKKHSHTYQKIYLLS